MGNFSRYLIGRGSTKDGSKAGGSAINKFNPPLSKDYIIGST